MKKPLLALLVFIYICFNLQGLPLQARAEPNNPDTEKDTVADKLSGFSARIKDKKIHLNWIITNPQQTYYIIVLKLNPQTKVYEPADDQDSRMKKSDYFEKSKDDEGNLLLKYNYVDEPSRDGVYYYKIEGLDITGKEVFKSDEIKIGITGIRDFELDQNHPNPFNPTTIITYTLYNSTHVLLKVYDLIGKEITTLVDQTQNAGQYSVEFDASKFPNLTSGIYFYKMDTDKYTDVKKMILTK